jgi:phospholipid/cholesterol/gamma-HCH transport system ATP-binding protein
VLLIEGKVVASGTPDELARGDNEIAREFIDKSGVDVNHLSRAPRRAGS